MCDLAMYPDAKMKKWAIGDGLAVSSDSESGDGRKKGGDAVCFTGQRMSSPPWTG